MSASEAITEDFPEHSYEFEVFKDHEAEHKQLSKILKYLKNFLNTLMIQILFDRFSQKKKNDLKHKRIQEIVKMDFNFEKMIVSLITGM